MSARPDPLEHGRWWDGTWNPVGGCRVVDTSCDNCYAPWRAAGIQTATGKKLYIGTTKRDEDGKDTWNGRLTYLPPDHPAWDYPFNWKGAAQPLLGPGKMSLLWVGSMADIFLPGRPPEVIDRIITTVALSRHIGIILTKHPTVSSPRGCVGASGLGFRRALRRALMCVGSGCARSLRTAGLPSPAFSRS